MDQKNNDRRNASNNQAGNNQPNNNKPKNNQSGNFQSKNDQVRNDQPGRGAKIDQQARHDKHIKNPQHDRNAKNDQHERHAKIDQRRPTAEAGQGSSNAKTTQSTHNAQSGHNARSAHDEHNEQTSTGEGKKKRSRSRGRGRGKTVEPSLLPTATPKAGNKKLRIIPLGGLSEIGKNMMLIEYGDEMIMIDAGMTFPDDEMLGIDLVLPDFTYVIQNKRKLKAIIITHGHEDHTGALPYLLRDVKAPIYGSSLTLGLIGRKLDEAKIKGDLRVVTEATNLKVNNDIEVEFVSVCHSIPDAFGLIIKTPLGPIIHSGDFKIDPNPVDGKVCDISRFAAYCNKALILMSDSTGAETQGVTKPERSVGITLLKVMQEAKGRVIVASFASHIHRIQQVINVCQATNRKLAIVGRSMIENVRVAQELGYIDMPKDMSIDVAKMHTVEKHRVAILTTGSQGEPMAALSRMAAGDHKHVQIAKDDTIIVSASPIPGNRKSVSSIINRMFKQGARVYHHEVSDVHVSGHAAKEDLRMFLNLIKPKYFIPVHGEYRHLYYHKEIAKEVGMDENDIFIIDNGDIVEFDKYGARVKGKVRAGTIFVDGLGVGDIGQVVLRDRQVLANDGIFIVVATVDQQTGRLISKPDIVTRGFIYVKDAQQLMDESQHKVESIFKQTSKEHITDYTMLKNKLHTDLGRFLYQKTKRQPMILPVIIEL